MNNVAKKWLIIADIIIGAIICICIAIAGIRDAINNHQFNLEVRTNAAKISVLESQVKVRDLLIAKADSAISNYLPYKDSLEAENKALRAYIQQTQKIKDENITSYRRMSDNDRLREFAELIR